MHGSEKTPRPLPKRPGQTIVQTIPEEHEMLIGRLIVAWSRLEQPLEEAIWAFLGVGVEDGRIITAKLDFTYKRNLFRGLVERHLNKTATKNISSWLKRVTELYEIRSWAAHGTWITILPDNIVAVTSLRQKIGEESPRNMVVTMAMSRDYLKNVTTHIEEVRDYFIDLCQDIIAHMQLSNVE